MGSRPGGGLWTSADETSAAGPGVVRGSRVVAGCSRANRAIVIPRRASTPRRLARRDRTNSDDDPGNVGERCCARPVGRESAQASTPSSSSQRGGPAVRAPSCSHCPAGAEASQSGGMGVMPADESCPGGFRPLVGAKHVWPQPKAARGSVRARANGNKTAPYPWATSGAWTRWTRAQCAWSGPTRLAGRMLPDRPCWVHRSGPGAATLAL